MNIIVDTFKEKFQEDKINTKSDIIHELREISQRIVIAALAQTDFYSKASFHGGTSLRLLYNTDRYSEDLDFSLDKTENNFSWKPYLDCINEFSNQYGCSFEVLDKSKDNNSIKKAFVKNDSLSQILRLSQKISSTPEKINIKLEMDTNPPLFAEHEIKTQNFPIKHNLKIHNLPTLFAGKCHALICREYDKGRDWSDFNWFVKNKISPNYKYLSSLLNQLGQWKGQNIDTNKDWICKQILIKSEKLNYNDINKDIIRFTNSKNNGILFDKNTINNLVSEFSSIKYDNPTQSTGIKRK